MTQQKESVSITISVTYNNNTAKITQLFTFPSTNEINDFFQVIAATILSNTRVSDVIKGLRSLL